ncbi:unnamed protein product, partial [Schistosoma mattheei]
VRCCSNVVLTYSCFHTRKTTVIYHYYYYCYYFIGTDITNDEEVAIKLECVKAKHPQLQIEAKIYKLMQGGVGIPCLKWSGTEGDYNVLVIQLLGPSLEDLFNFCGRRFKLKTVLLLADQTITRVEYIQNKNFIHR